ncbi:MAG: hypothetical protein JXR29_13195 [Methylothermaceae bacterium]|nr:hypothetical protein [Methylothermaceae bacterium]
MTETPRDDYNSPWKQALEKRLPEGLERQFLESVSARVLQADAETLLVWSERVLSADSLEEIFR